MSEKTNQEQTENKKQAVKDPFAETVKIKLPLIKGKGDVHVGVNGRFWQIQRGVEVNLPRPVLEVLQHQEEMELLAQEYEEALAKKSAAMDKT